MIFFRLYSNRIPGVTPVCGKHGGHKSLSSHWHFSHSQIAGSNSRGCRNKRKMSRTVTLRQRSMFLMEAL